jgi:predicted ribosome quality control (RQC) complex YloA/Tae2 family protein
MVKIEEYIYKNNTYKISIGQNARDNWNLIDLSNIDDIWFHTSQYPSAHVVVSYIHIIPQVKKLPRQVIKRCAYICKVNSKAKSETDVEIIYTKINNVTKTDVVGQVMTTNVKSVVL